MTGQQTPLGCDICGSRLNQDGLTLACTSCEQKWFFTADGHASCIILNRLYPQKMNRKMRLEWYDYKLSAFTFIQDALALLGIITPEERNNRVADATQKTREAREPLLKQVPRWKFWQ